MGQWKPSDRPLEDFRQIRGQKHNSETIGSIGFHHVEFYCGDARSMAQRFSLGLGIPIVGSTGQHTGNDKCISYALANGDARFLLTAPYSKAVSGLAMSDRMEEYDAPDVLPGFKQEDAHTFFAKHGLAARAMGVEVKDCRAAFKAACERGGIPVLEPTLVNVCPGQKKSKNEDAKVCYISEIELYGDVVLRFISFPEKSHSDLPFLPHLNPMKAKIPLRGLSGIHTIDHAVGNVPDLHEAHSRMVQILGFHEFAEFTAEDVGTVDSGLNSVVLASDAEAVLLPMNEPTSGK